MSTIRERIQFAAGENTRLSQTISETAYSISAHQQSQTHVEHLRKELANEEKNLADINRQVEKEYKDHKKYRDSYVKRLAYKLGGKEEKFSERATKEEKEWLDALAAQLKMKKVLETLNRNLTDAKQTRDGFLAVVEVHKAAKTELDALYRSVFQGPTPGFPEEDAKENEVAQAESKFNDLQLRLSTEQQVRDLLGNADKFLRRAMLDIQDAERSATADVWNVGGTFAEMAENNALSRCQQHVSQVEMLVSQAQRIQPVVNHIGYMRVAQMDFLSNVVFDNIFSDLAMRDRIVESMAQLSNSQMNLAREIQTADQRIFAVQLEVDEAKGLLDGKRRELQQIRATAFERFANEGQVEGSHENAAAPPAYSA